MSNCLWCGSAFTPRATGGKPQRFCGPPCRRDCDAAGRRWVAEAIAGGSLTLDQLRNGVVATRALLSGAISPAPIRPAHKPAPVAPAERSGEAEILLNELLDVRSEGWPALAEAMSEELFSRLKRWRAGLLAKDRAQIGSRIP